MSCISEKFFNKIRHTLDKDAPLDQNVPKILMSASGPELKVVGTADLNVNISGYVIVQRFIIIRDLYQPCVLGMDFFQSNQA